MRYMINCSLRGDIEGYHKKLVDDVAKKFDLKRVKQIGLPTHISLKYSQEIDDIKEIEKLIERFCKAHKKAKIRVGGFGNFGKDVVFIKAELSKEAQKIVSDFLLELKKIKSIELGPFDGENLSFHITIATNCNDKFDEVMNFLNEKEKKFDCWLDNITILKLVSGTIELGKWKVYKTYEIY